MDKSISDRIQDWTFQDSDDRINYNDIHALINFREDYYKEYHPTIGPFPPFPLRLQNWLDQVNSIDEQKLLFQLVPEIMFLSNADFISLYRTARNEQIVQWLVDLEDISIDDPQIDKRINDAIGRTWFCPITDSMHISDFLHVNNIEGQDYRPDWRSLAKFSNKKEINKYMDLEGLHHLVLLEDFVGSGSQIKKTIEFAASINKECNVLIIPLVICPDGDALGDSLEKKYSNIKFKPVLRLQKEMFIKQFGQAGEPNIHKFIRDLCIKLNSQVQGRDGPFGYHGMGAMIVMYTNCPDNTLELIHHRSERWEPLFPRSSRI